MVRQSGVSLAALRSALVGLPPCGEPSSRYYWHGNHMCRTSTFLRTDPSSTQCLDPATPFGFCKTLSNFAGVCWSLQQPVRLN